MVLIAAKATELPVVASRLGSMTDLIRHGKTGLHFEPGNPDDLAAQVEWLWTDPHDAAAMGEAARQEFLAHYTAKKDYDMLMAIYDQAVKNALARS